MKTHTIGIALLLTFALATARQEPGGIFRNPLTGRLRVPIVNQSLFGAGEHGGGYINRFEIKPVIPITFGKADLINRIIIPYLYESESASEEGGFLGIEPISWTVFFSPSVQDPLSWGVGPFLLFPIGNDHRLGSAGIGGFQVAVIQRWTFALLAKNIWSFSDEPEIIDVSMLTLEYYLTFEAVENWYLRSVSTLEADWEAGGEKWTIPLGLGVGYETETGGVALGFAVQGFGFVATPKDGPHWKIEVEVEVKVAEKDMR